MTILVSKMPCRARRFSPRLRAIAGFFALLCLSGCGSSPNPKFYVLNSEPAARQTPRAAGIAVQVSAVHLPSLLDRQEIVRRSSTNGVEISDQNRWGAPLDEMTRRVLAEDLKKRLPANNVILANQPAPSAADKIVVTVDEFGPGTDSTVLLEGDWSLVPPDAATPDLTRSFHISKPASGDYGAQVKAMSDALADLADDMARALASRRAP